MGLDLEKEMTADTVIANRMLDPVFNTEVSADSAYVSGYKGKLYYFCSVCSKKLFEEHPEIYTRE